MKMKRKATKQLLSWIFDQFFLNEHIRRSSVANTLVFCAERVKEWYCNLSEILEPNATENVNNCLLTLKRKTE